MENGQTLYFRYNIDPTSGQPISVKIDKENKRVNSEHCTIQLEQVPNELHSVTILDEDNNNMFEVYNRDEIVDNTYYVDYNNGVVYFDKSQSGKVKIYDYYGTGLLLIGCSRIYDENVQDSRKPLETLQEILDSGREALNAMSLIGDVATIIKKLEKDLVDAEFWHNTIVDDVNKIAGTENKTFSIPSADFIVSTDGNYEYVLTHNMNTLKLIYHAKNTDTKRSVEIETQEIDVNRTKIITNRQENMTIIVNALYYTESQATINKLTDLVNVGEEIIEVLDDVTSKINESGNKSFNILVSNWTDNAGDTSNSLYKYNLNHNMYSSNLQVSVRDSDTQMAVLPVYKVVDNRNIVFYSNVKNNLSIVLSASYYNGNASLNGIKATEIYEARGGKVDLNTRISDIDILKEEYYDFKDGDFKVVKDEISSLNDNIEDVINKQSLLDQIKLQVVYGAKGDGITDDTSSIQKALNNEKYIYFNGKYKTTSYLVIKDSTFLDFKTGSEIIRGGGSSHYKVFVNGIIGTSNFIGYNGNGNIHFRNATINLNCDNNPLAPSLNATVMDVGHGQNFSFIDCTFKNGQNGHYFQISGSRDVVFDRCKFYNQLHLNTSSYNYEAIQIETISSLGFPTFGSYDLTPSQNVTIQNCYFNGVIRAIGTHSDILDESSSIVYSKNINIENNIFDTSVDDMLCLRAYENISVKNNYIKNAGGYGINLMNCKDGNVKDNKIDTCGKSGLQTSGVSGVNFKDNIYNNACKISNGGTVYSAIRTFDTTKCTFDGEIVKADTPYYSNAMYMTTSPNNKITGRCSFQAGVSSGNNGLLNGDSASIGDNMLHDNVVLFSGDLTTVGSIGVLSESIYTFKMIIVVGNDNSSDTAALTSVVLPKAILTHGSPLSRFRLIPDSGLSSGTTVDDRVGFSFESDLKIRLDEVYGTCHIRKVIGIR